MAKDESVKSLETALAHVNKDRRGFLKVLLAGSAAAAALPMLTSETLAQDQGGDGKGEGDGTQQCESEKLLGFHRDCERRRQRYDARDPA